MSPAAGQRHRGRPRRGLLALWVLQPDGAVDEILLAFLVHPGNVSLGCDGFAGEIHSPVLARQPPQRPFRDRPTRSRMIPSIAFFKRAVDDNPRQTDALRVGLVVVDLVKIA